MAFKFKGDLSVARAVYLGSMDTIKRLAFIPDTAGAVVYDSTENSIYVWDGAAWQKVDSTKHNFSATSAPTSTNDSAEGYQVGSFWLNTAGNSVYFCHDATVGAAVWERLDSPKSQYSATTAPTPSDDDTAGFEQGSLWIDTTNRETYICYDATTGAAVWERLDQLKNMTATTAPTATDDSTAGFSVGSLWVDTQASNIYVCVDVTAGAAVWKRVDPKKFQATAAAPTPTDDGTAGYEVGSLWVNTADNSLFVCHDTTTGAAVWERLDGPKNNYAATTAPTSNNDATEGYEVGSLWVDTTNKQTYICYSASTGAAKWERLDQPLFHVSNTPPSVFNSSDTGFEIGSLWFDTQAGNMYACYDDTPFFAIWKRVNAKKVQAATFAPTANDDNTAGYEAGSLWVDTNTRKLYVCINPGAGVAEWERVDQPKINVGTTAPTANDDDTQRYEPGSMWFDTTARKTYVCYDATTGAAVWGDISTAKSNVATIPPTVTDDSTKGYEVGSLWIDSAKAKSYICYDATAGAAVWERVDSPKLNVGAAAPTIADDSTKGYEAGAIWLDTVTNRSYICVDATAGAARWVRTSNPKIGTGTSNPTATTDSSQGYEVGSLFINTATNSVFVAASVATGNAVWKKIDNIKNAFTYAAPTASDDVNAGYEVGSIWTDAGSGTVYICEDATASAAKWSRINNAKTGITTTDPTFANDAIGGYEVGSIWVNMVTKKVFMCVNSSPGSAVWVPLTSIKNNVAATAPSNTDDSSAGYEVGSLWVDTAAQTVYLCMDATASAAIWERLDNAKNNTAATSPTANDDLSAGYEVGSLWFDTGNNKVFVCQDTTTGSAQWVEIETTKIGVSAANPTATDDSSAGYIIGSLWVNTSTQKAFVCVDNTASAAVWQQLINAKGTVTTTSPTATDDSSAGYEPGSWWVNTTDNQFFICYDATAGAAVWERIDQPVMNVSASAPTASDDATKGYEAGSIWVDTAAKKSYMCLDASNGAAVWKPMDTPKLGSGAFGPLVSDDSTKGYEIGSLFHNTTTNKFYVAADVTPGAAVWELITERKFTTASVPPSGSDNSAAGFDVGSIWIDSTAGHVYICRDLSTAVAQWERIDNIPASVTTADPTSTDDSSAGYEIGSVWVNTTTQKVFICVDDAVGAAVWIPSSGVKNNVSNAAPTTTDDSSASYSVGSLWFDTAAQNTYVCLDATVGAAVWERLDSPKYTRATTAPAATDDSTKGYEAGSLWFDTSARKTYVCYDATANAAVWLTVSSPQLNAAATSPAATDDASKGYEIGSLWVDTSTGTTYVCLDATTSSAVWERLDQPKFSISNVAPTATDDSASGYEVGSFWFDTSSQKTYVCYDATAGAAIWKALGSANAVVSATDPTVTDDNTAGHAVGTLWVNTTTNTAYVAVDVTTGAAIWKQITHNSRVFITDTATNPATPGSPTTAEAMGAAGAVKNVIVHYNGTDTETSDPTHVWYVDDGGNFTKIESPLGDTPTNITLTFDANNQAAVPINSDHVIATLAHNNPPGTYTLLAPTGGKVGAILDLVVTTTSTAGAVLEFQNGGYYSAGGAQRVYAATVYPNGPLEVRFIKDKSGKWYQESDRSYKLVNPVDLKNEGHLSTDDIYISNLGDYVVPMNTAVPYFGIYGYKIDDRSATANTAYYDELFNTSTVNADLQPHFDVYANEALKFTAGGPSLVNILPPVSKDKNSSIFSPRRIVIVNEDTQPHNVAFDQAAYVDERGTPIGTIQIGPATASQKTIRMFTFHETYENGRAVYRLLGSATTNDGMPSVNVNSSGTPALNTRELLDDLAVITRTLPHATGSGKIIEFQTGSNAFGNPKTIAVTPGDSLNGVNGGTYTIMFNNTTYRATDYGVSSWVLDKISGAVITRGLSYLQARLNTGWVLTAGVDVPFNIIEDTVGDITLSNGRISLKGGRRYRISFTYHVNGMSSPSSYVHFGLFSYTANTFAKNVAFTANGNPATGNQQETSGNYYSLMYAPSADEDVSIRVYFLGTPGTLDSGATFLEVEELPSDVYVPADALMPVSLDYVSIRQNSGVVYANATAPTGGANAFDLSDINLSIYDSNGLVDNTNSEVVIKKSGRYRLFLNSGHTDGSSTVSPEIRLNGTPIGSTTVTDASNPSYPLGIDMIHDLNPNDVVSFHDTNPASGRSNFTAVVQQLPTEHAIYPGVTKVAEWTPIALFSVYGSAGSPDFGWPYGYRAVYKVIGNTMYMNVQFDQVNTSTPGVDIVPTSGNNYYQIYLPGGYGIDQSSASIHNPGDPVPSGTVLGSGYIVSDVASGSLTVVPSAPSAITFIITTSTTLANGQPPEDWAVPSTGNYKFGFSRPTLSFSFNAVIPVKKY